MEMDKLLSVPVSSMVKSGATSGDGSSTLKLIDAGQTFTQEVLVGDYVYDTTTNSGTGGEFYKVSAIDSDTQLSLTSVGPATNPGVPSGATYYVFSGTSHILAAGSTTSTSANNLVMSTGTFVSGLTPVKVGDTVTNQTDATTATVTAVTNDTTLALSADIMANSEVFIVTRETTLEYTQLLGASDIALTENVSTDAQNASITIRYGSASGVELTLQYIPDGIFATGDETVRNAFQNYVIGANEQEWSQPSYPWTKPHVLNVTDNGTTDATAAFALIESGQNFTSTVSVGNTAVKLSTSETATVTAVVSDTQLTLDRGIFVSGEAYQILGPNKNFLPVFNIATSAI